MKNFNHAIILIFLLSGFAINTVAGQTKFIDQNGKIVFEASEELFEPVKATNESVTMLLNVDSSEIAALALVKGFRFKNSLMEEHFNENYIESETYPKATFKGKLQDFNVDELSDTVIEVMVKGSLKLHGKEKEILTPLEIKKSGDLILLHGTFSVTPADFDIEIPKIVKNKIAKEILIEMDFKRSKK